MPSSTLQAQFQDSNSLNRIGPSFYIGAPKIITYTLAPSRFKSSSGDAYYTSSDDFACWSAFRANNYVLADSVNDFARAFHVDTLENSTTYDTVDVRYTSNCTEFLNNVDKKTALADATTLKGNGNGYYSSYDHVIYARNSSTGANCALGVDVVCGLRNPKPRTCRMVRNSSITLFTTISPLNLPRDESVLVVFY